MHLVVTDNELFILLLQFFCHSDQQEAYIAYLRTIRVKNERSCNYIH